MLGDPLDTALRAYVLPGERLLWTGRPAPGIRFTRQDLFLIPFSLLWGGFAIFWNVLVWRSGAPIFFNLWGLPFLLVAVYITVGRFLLEAFLRSRTVYGVSNRRILFLRRPPMPRFRSIEIGYLPMFEYEEHSNGRGTIRFDEERTSPWFSGHSGAWHPSFGATSQFDRIEEPRRVYELIRSETERWRREQFGAEAASRSFIG
jgi:hypothetical protein